MRWLSKLKDHMENTGARTRNRGFHPIGLAAEVLECRALLSGLSVHATPTPVAAITHLGGPVTYVADSPPVILAGSAVVTDSANAFANSKLSLAIVSSAAHPPAAGDQLGIAAVGGVTLDGSGGVLDNGTLIGNVTGGTGGAPLVVTFNASATKTGVQAVLDAVDFSNTNVAPLPGVRVAVFKFTDGNGNASRPATKEVIVDPAAAITNLGGPVTYVAGSPPVILASSAVVTDTANAFANSTLKVSLLLAPSPIASGGDQLGIAATGGVTLNGTGGVLFNGTLIGSIAGGTGGAPLVVTFNGSADQLGVQAVLDAATFSSSSTTPFPGARVAVFEFTDGNGSASLPVSKAVIVTPAVAITHLGGPVTYAAGSPPVILASSAVVTDTANAFANSTLKISILGAPPPLVPVTTGDQLGIAATGGVTLNGSGGVLFNGTLIGTVTGGTSAVPLMVKFNASATQAGVQAVLDAVTYSNSSPAPLPGVRFALFQLTDGNGNSSLPVSKEIIVTPAAAIAQLGGPVSYVAGSAPVVLAGSAVVSDTANAFANSKLKVSILSPLALPVATGDELGIAASGGVTLDGNGGVLYNGTLIATVAGGTSGVPLVVTFNASATQPGVQAVLDAVTFSNPNAAPVRGPRFAVFQFTDGNGSASLPVSKRVDVTH
jgi:hypothetical protein